jgi:hypothetical protein
MPAPNPLLFRPLAAADASTRRAFERRLRSAKKSDKTVQSYLEAARLLAGWLGGGVTLEEVRPADIEDGVCVRRKLLASRRASLKRHGFHAFPSELERITTCRRRSSRAESPGCPDGAGASAGLSVAESGRSGGGQAAGTGSRDRPPMVVQAEVDGGGRSGGPPRPEQAEIKAVEGGEPAAAGRRRNPEGCHNFLRGELDSRSR